MIMRNKEVARMCTCACVQRASKCVGEEKGTETREDTHWIFCVQ